MTDIDAVITNTGNPFNKYITFKDVKQTQFNFSYKTLGWSLSELFKYLKI